MDKALVWLLPALPLLALLAASSTASADWVVDSTKVITGETRTLDTNLVVEKGGDLTLDSVKWTVSGTTITVKDGGRLTVLNSTLAGAPGAGGNETRRYFSVVIYGEARLERSGFAYLAGSWDAAGVQVRSGAVTIANCTFTNSQRDGVTVFSGAPVITGNTFTAGVAGIRVVGGAPHITGNTILYPENSGIILLDGSGGTVVESNSVSGGSLGIGLYRAPATLMNNTVVSGRIGMDISEVPAIVLSGNTILSSAEVGLRLQGSSTTFSGGRIESASTGILAVGANVTLRATTLAATGAGGGTAVIQHGGNLIPGEGLNYTGWAYRYQRRWVLTVFVKDTGGRLAGNASVTVTDAAGDVVGQGRTGDTGSVEFGNLTEYRIDMNGATRTMTPHRVTVAGGSMKGTLSVRLDGDMVVAATLRPGGEGEKGFIPDGGAALLAFAVALAAASRALEMRNAKS